VEWYGYKSQALPTGAIAYRINVPVSKIAMDSISGEALAVAGLFPLVESFPDHARRCARPQAGFFLWLEAGP